MSKPERDKLLGHAADNDGIEEYDNPLPDWWVGLFLFTIVFAIGYTIDYHFISHRSQAASYDAEVAEAAKRWPVKEDAGGEADLSDAAIAEGATIFAANCVACHGPELLGGIGPNLTDGIWIHGGSYDEIRTTITKGVPEKGMLTWGPILGPEKVAKVAAFVYSKGPKLGVHASPATAPNAATPTPAPADGAAPPATTPTEGAPVEGAPATPAASPAPAQPATP